MAKIGKFVGKQDVELTQEEINQVKEIFTTICNERNLTFNINYISTDKMLQVSVELPYEEGLYRNKSTLQTYKLRSSMLFLIYNRKGFIQEGNAGDTNFNWNTFNHKCNTPTEWDTTQYTLKSSVNMSTREYKHKNWYGSSIETHDYNTNISELGIKESITRALNILSNTKKIK